MNKYIILLLTSIAFPYLLKAQCPNTQMYDIYTPNGNPVVTWLMCESSTQTRLNFDTQYAQTYPNATQIPTYNSFSSTRKFVTIQPPKPAINLQKKEVLNTKREQIPFK